MVATHIKKINHSILCVTGVYLRDIIYTIFIFLHLNVSRLSVCSSCLFVCLFVFCLLFSLTFSMQLVQTFSLFVQFCLCILHPAKFYVFRAMKKNTKKLGKQQINQEWYVQIWNKLVAVLILTTLVLFFIDNETEYIPRNYFRKYLAQNASGRSGDTLPSRRLYGIWVSKQTFSLFWLCVGPCRCFLGPRHLACPTGLYPKVSFHLISPRLRLVES